MPATRTLAREAAASCRDTAVIPVDRIARDAQTAGGEDRDPAAGPETPCLLVHTSGTTGHPKGAVLTQHAIQVNALNCVHYAGLAGADRVLTVLPLFHVGGLNILTSPAFYVGGTVILHRRFDAGATLRAIVEERPTQLVLVPATIQAVIDLRGWSEADLSSLRMLATGSSIVPLHLIDAVHARGIPVCQTYGLTETAPVSIYQKPGDGLRKPRSTGKCGLHCEIRIVDDDGNEVPAGVSGEILIRGGNVLREYWNNEEETRRALRGGWFHTGDVACRDEEGDVFVNDRKKDVVISGGENIYPAEIELLVHRMDDIADVAVGRDARTRGGAKCRSPSSSLPRARGSRPRTFSPRFEGRLARFKHPKDVLFLDALPRNAMGKTQKHELRERVKRKPGHDHVRPENGTVGATSIVAPDGAPAACPGPRSGGDPGSPCATSLWPREDPGSGAGTTSIWVRTGPPARPRRRGKAAMQIAAGCMTPLRSGILRPFGAFPCPSSRSTNCAARLGTWRTAMSVPARTCWWSPVRTRSRAWSMRWRRRPTRPARARRPAAVIACPADMADYRHPAPVVAAVERAGLTVVATSIRFPRAYDDLSPALFAAGRRQVLINNAPLEDFVRGAALADPLALRDRTRWLAGAVSAARSVRVRSPNGTVELPRFRGRLWIWASGGVVCSVRS